jgi:hypothetical protein
LIYNISTGEVEIKALTKALILMTLLLSIAGYSAWDDGVGGENGFNVPNGCSPPFPGAGGTPPEPVDCEVRQWATCKRIEPSGCGGTGVFVPTKTQVEWRAFVSNVPACVTLTTIPCY